MRLRVRKSSFRVPRPGRKQKTVSMESMLHCSTPACLLYERMTQSGAPRCLCSAHATRSNLHHRQPNTRGTTIRFSKTTYRPRPPWNVVAFVLRGFSHRFFLFFFFFSIARAKSERLDAVQKKPDSDQLGSRNITKREKHLRREIPRFLVRMADHRKRRAKYVSERKPWTTCVCCKCELQRRCFRLTRKPCHRDTKR